MGTDWKSTVSGILSGIIGSVGPLTAYLATTPYKWQAEACAVLTVLGIVAKVWVGIITKNQQTDQPVLPLPMKGNENV